MNGRASTHTARMEQFCAAGLYLVTSHSLSAGRPTLKVVEEALEAGVRLVQLREKELSTRQLVELARKVREMTWAADALLLINDRLDVALAVGADGVHLGQDDLPVADARRLAPDLILGVSTHGEAEAVEAQQQGASYINIGPLFPTRTKAWGGAFLGWEGLERVAAVTRIPFTVMGGIRPEHVPGLIHRGATAVAVVTAVTAASDVRTAVRDFLERIALARGAW